MANGIIVPNNARLNGTTNNNHITWEQSGNTVLVSVFGVSMTNGQAITITGLPKPKNEAYVRAPLYFSSGSLTGYMQYYEGEWKITPIATDYAYSSFTYIV